MHKNFQKHRETQYLLSLNLEYTGVQQESYFEDIADFLELTYNTRKRMGGEKYINIFKCKKGLKYM